MSANAAQTTAVVRKDVAVAPLATIAKEDAGSALEQFDAWLKSVSDGYITLERVEQLANCIPVVSNILSAVDVVMDIKQLIEAEAKDFFDYLNLGIDLIGVIPVPPVMGEFRMGARPLMKLAREELSKSAKTVAQGGAQMIADTIISVLVAGISAKFAGDIEKFIQEVQSQLAQLLDDCAKHAKQLLEGIAQIFENAASGKLFDTSGNYRAAGKHIGQAGDAFVAHDATRVAENLWSYLKDGTKVMVKDAANLASRAANVISPSTNQRLMHMAGQARNAIPMVTEKIKGLNSANVGGLIWLLDALMKAVIKWKDKQKHNQTVGIKAAGKVEAELKKTEGELETIGAQAKAKHPGANDCKSCGLGRSGGSIGYALGDERFDHEDFVLPGAMPVVWRRTYRSFLAAYDESSLGARWITPYTTRFDIHAAKLVYHDQSGRSLDYPLLKAGETHDDLAENLTLARLDDQWLTLTRGHELLEAYEKRGDAFHLAFLRDRNGNQVTLDYDEAHRLTRLITSQGVVVFSHDAGGRLIEAAEVNQAGERIGTLVRYTYDRHGDLVAATDRHGNRREYAYTHHLVTRYTDRTGRGMNLEWDGTGPRAKCVREYADDGSHDTRLAWHPDIRLVDVTDGPGNVTRHYFDIDGYTYRIIHADGLNEWFYRDAQHNLTQHIYPDGTVERFTYDRRGNLTGQTRRDGSVVRMEYDAKDQMTVLIDPHAYRWTREYDDAGNVATQVDPLGHRTQYSYNAQGLPTEIVDAKGGARTLAYDAAGRLVRYTDCSGKTTRWAYDVEGRLTESRDAGGRSVVYRYGGNGQLAAVQSAAGTEKLEYDAEGRLLVHTDALDRVTRYGYDAAGRIANRRDASGELLTYRYDRAGRLSALTDSNRATYQFHHDPVGRLIEETGFDGMSTRYTYDAATGQLQSIDEAGQTTRLEYDNGGRLARRVCGASDERFMYDGSGRLIDAQNAVSRVQHFFDPVGNLVREHHAQQLFDERRSYVWRHEYDETGTRIRTVRPDGHALDWLVYGTGHVHGMQLNGQELIQFERDGLHRETQRTLSNRIVQDTRYDPLGRMEAQALRRSGAPAPIVARRYQYDAAGQLKEIDDSRQGVTRYQYDPVGRLLEAVSPLATERFAFDPAGNIVDAGSPAQARSGGAQPSSTLPAQIPKVLGNLLKDYAGTHFSYDARGNLVEKRSAGAGQRYEWDEFNRMSAASVDEPARRHEVRYFYDAFGRRIGKDVDGVRTTYGWDGDTLAYESVEEGSTHYVYEAGSFVPLAQFVSAPVRGIDTPGWKPTDRYAPEDDPLLKPVRPASPAHVFYYHCDQLGTPQLLTDELGEVVWEARYRAWGEAREVIARVSKATLGAARNPIRFQGQQRDEETGLAYNRYRYYDPQSGRFVSKDPIGLAGGINAYAYAPNPISWIDPLGLSGATPPTITAADITDKTRTEIRGLANQRGLVVAKQDASGAPIKWKCPCTGKERLRLDRGHIDQSTGLPYNDPKAAVDHVHAYDPTGKVKVVSPVDGNPHFPTTGE
ncbi:RHS repeat-associated core domain-containing protein [Paraburkholderia dinghuensis]|uniref:RHS repeat protein n=1 Tax=Paraburkholderia dinghuensis TaxID=2305225 RepID=A0A3N6MJY9_9BURK|nr:RHS repeat-associated core domain-containing protein [Paraburkholderia dinghuensis]RQH01655.1 RHS repeat protein [Paraburkholderia dinghuensis]